MLNKNKKVIFLIILLIMCPLGLIIKDRLLSKEDLYILTENNEVSKDMLQEQDIIIEKSMENEDNITEKLITVYISGEVNKPGIVNLSNDDRLATAVEMVGGTTENADLNSVNMAIKLQDEMHYIIPKIGDVIKENDSKIVDNNTNQGEISKTSLININKATLEELDKLPGVGEATANKIVNHRNENGEFKSIDEIKNVNGIGDKKFEDIKNLICVK